MDEDMNVGELLKETAEENQTRKILEILNECKDLAEAKERVTPVSLVILLMVLCAIAIPKS